MEGAMNRQAKIRGFTTWFSYGAVTHAEAAKQHANRMGTIEATIQTRDADDPDKTFLHRVTSKTTMEVHSFRGD